MSMSCPGAIQGQVLRQGEAWVRLPGQPPEQDAQLYLRPHEVRLVPKPTPHACLPFTVEAVSLIGAEVRVELSPAGWESEEIWEVGISHGEFARQPLARAIVGTRRPMSVTCSWRTPRSRTPCTGSRLIIWRRRAQASDNGTSSPLSSRRNSQSQRLRTRADTSGWAATARPDGVLRGIHHHVQAQRFMPPQAAVVQGLDR